MARLTVFTPTYNRRELLYRCFESLQRQSSTDFLWLIIDDGSTDDTDKAVIQWQAQGNPFEIRYKYKDNGGLHTAYNTAIELLDTELAMCLDSDDFLPDNAVNRIINFWQENGAEYYAGIAGLDYSINGKLISDPILAVKSINLIDIAIGKNKNSGGDRKYIVRSELYKQVAPMPVYMGEKNFNPHYMHLQISKHYDFLVLNENLCFVQYQPAGMSNSIFWQYYNSPQSFAEIRKLLISLPFTSWPYRFRQYIHYTSSCMLAGRDLGIQNPNKLMMLLARLPGYLLYHLILYKNRKPAVEKTAAVQDKDNTSK